jgi:transcriptional regulator with XRE-family HTH domain/tetratricopeptide (TPR) repeat protein
MAQVFNHELLQKARLELDLTQEQVAAAVGVDVRTYRRYESGAVNDPRSGFSVRQPARRRLLERLSAELGISTAELLVDATSAASPPASPLDLPPLDPPRPVAPRSPEEPAACAWSPLHVHTLQRAVHFVGRREILDTLSAWALTSPPSPRVIALIGVGGAGKTAIAERFLQGLGEAPRPFGLFIWSFYDDPRTEAFLDQAARYFAPDDGAASPSLIPPGERLPRLQEALRKGPPHLLLLDGLETVQAEGGGGRAHGELGDALLRRLLCAVARGLGNTRVLVTSRFELADLISWSGEGIQTIRPGSLSPKDATGLLRRWGIRGDDPALLELSDGTGGHALSIAMLGSYVGAFLGGDPDRFDRKSLSLAEQDDVLARRLQAVLSAYARALSPAERDLLSRLSVFSGGADEAVLLSLIEAGGDLAGSMAGWSAADLRRGIARLTRLGLVFSTRRGGPSYSAHPFVQQHFKALLGVPQGRIHAAQHRAQAPSLDKTPHQPVRDEAGLDAYEALLLHLLDTDRASEAFGVYMRALGGFANLGLRLGDMARGARVLRAFARGDDPRGFPATLPASMRAGLAYEQGLYAGALGDLAFACRCYEAHNEIEEAAFEASGLVTGLRTLGYTERLRGELSSARRRLERSIDLAERAGYPGQMARGVALLAAVLHDLGEVDAADERFVWLAAMGDAKVARRGLWEAEHNLALGRWEAARAATLQNLATCAKLGWEGHVAHCHAVLGFAAAPRDPDAAAEHLGKARGWAEKAGEVEMVLRCHELGARVALARGRREEGSWEATLGLSLAETCGFGPMQSRLGTLAARCAPPEELGVAMAFAEAAIRAAGEDAWARADALHWAGMIEARVGGRERAVGWLEEAATLRGRICHPEAAASREALARARAGAR